MLVIWLVFPPGQLARWAAERNNSRLPHSAGKCGLGRRILICTTGRSLIVHL